MRQLIDARGKACPIPVVLAKKEIDGGAVEFTVQVDNQTAMENLQRLADSQGYRTTVESADGVFQVDFTKAPNESGSAPEKLVDVKPSVGTWSVFVGRDIVGSGDPELGRSLMKMFFYTLTQAEDLPASLLFMNDGVKLPTQDAQIVEHLRALANKGVEILVCGTCLNFYNLSEQLQVGTVSNMYDIVQRMKQAQKVVSL